MAAFVSVVLVLAIFLIGMGMWSVMEYRAKLKKGILLLMRDGIKGRNSWMSVNYYLVDMMLFIAVEVIIWCMVIGGSLSIFSNPDILTAGKTLDFALVTITILATLMAINMAIKNALKVYASLEYVHSRIQRSFFDTKYTTDVSIGNVVFYENSLCGGKGNAKEYIEYLLGENTDIRVDTDIQNTGKPVRINIEFTRPLVANVFMSDAYVEEYEDSPSVETVPETQWTNGNIYDMSEEVLAVDPIAQALINSETEMLAENDPLVVDMLETLRKLEEEGKTPFSGETESGEE